MDHYKTHSIFMQQALKEAKKALKKDEVPVGAIAVLDGKIIARAHNTREKTKSPLDHAELKCIKKVAKKLGDWRLNDVTLYVTLEPCPMCAGALGLARIGTLVYGAKDPNYGAVASRAKLLSMKHMPNKSKVVGGILREECSKILKDFFKEKRRKDML